MKNIFFFETIVSFLFCCCITVFFTTTALADTKNEKLEHVQAMEFGLFFGGAASQYDECANRGLVKKSTPLAVVKAEKLLKDISQHDHNQEQLADYKRGWDLIKEKLKSKDAKFWKAHCDRIDKQWNKYVVMYKLN